MLQKSCTIVIFLLFQSLINSFNKYFILHNNKIFKNNKKELISLRSSSIRNYNQYSNENESYNPNLYKSISIFSPSLQK